MRPSPLVHAHLGLFMLDSAHSASSVPSPSDEHMMADSRPLRGRIWYARLLFDLYLRLNLTNRDFIDLPILRETRQRRSIAHYETAHDFYLNSFIDIDTFCLSSTGVYVGAIVLMRGHQTMARPNATVSAHRQLQDFHFLHMGR